MIVRLLALVVLLLPELVHAAGDTQWNGKADRATVRATGTPSDRSLSDRARERVAVTDYGVKGDGTDETRKIQKAITENAGRSIFFPVPPVAYRVTAPLIVAANTMLVGEGFGSKLVRSGADSTILSVGDGVVVRELWLAHDGATEPTSGALISYVHLADPGDPRGGNVIDHVRLTDGYDGILAQGVRPPGNGAIYKFVLRDSVIERSRGSGVHLKFVADAHLSNTWISGGVGAPAMGNGILFDEWNEGVSVEGMEIYGCVVGINLLGASSGVPFSTNGALKVSNSFVDSSTTGVKIAYFHGGEFSNVWVASSTIGYDVSDSGGLRINGGELVATTTGIWLRAPSNRTSPHTSIRGVAFAGGMTTAVRIDAPNGLFQVQSCQFGNVLWSGTITTGILVGAGASDAYVIADNIFYGTTTKVTDGGTGVNKRVENNY